MMKKKIKISELKVSSFVTETKSSEIKAGMKMVDNPFEPTPNTRCFVC